MKKEIARLMDLLGKGSGNPYRGKKLFREHCGKSLALSRASPCNPNQHQQQAFNPFAVCLHSLSIFSN